MLSLLCLKCLKLKNRKVNNTDRSLLCCEEASQVTVEEDIMNKLDDTHVVFLVLKIPSKSAHDDSWDFLDRYGFRYCDVIPNRHKRRLLPSEVMAMLREVPAETKKKLAAKGYFPQDGYIMQYLPVLSNCLSVPDVSDGISVISSDLSLSALAKVLKQVETIKGSRSGASDFESSETEANDLQVAIAQYLQVRCTTQVNLHEQVGPDGYNFLSLVRSVPEKETSPAYLGVDTDDRETYMEDGYMESALSPKDNRSTQGIPDVSEFFHSVLPMHIPVVEGHGTSILICRWKNCIILIADGRAVSLTDDYWIVTEVFSKIWVQGRFLFALCGTSCDRYIREAAQWYLDNNEDPSVEDLRDHVSRLHLLIPREYSFSLAVCGYEQGICRVLFSNGTEGCQNIDYNEPAFEYMGTGSVSMGMVRKKLIQAPVSTLLEVLDLCKTIVGTTCFGDRCSGGFLDIYFRKSENVPLENQRYHLFLQAAIDYRFLHWFINFSRTLFLITSGRPHDALYEHRIEECLRHHFKGFEYCTVLGVHLIKRKVVRILCFETVKQRKAAFAKYQRGSVFRKDEKLCVHTEFSQIKFELRRVKLKLFVQLAVEFKESWPNPLIEAEMRIRHRPKKGPHA